MKCLPQGVTVQTTMRASLLRTVATRPYCILRPVQYNDKKHISAGILAFIIQSLMLQVSFSLLLCGYVNYTVYLVSSSEGKESVHISKSSLTSD